MTSLNVDPPSPTASSLRIALPSSSSQLMNLSEDLHLLILSFLDVRDLALMRRTCRGLHKTVGSLPATATVTLETCFWQRYRRKLADYDADSSNVTMYLPVQGSTIVGWGKSQWPRLAGIRPTGLYIDFPDDILSREGIGPVPTMDVVPLLYHILPQAAPTLQELSLSIHPGCCGSAVALRHAFQIVQGPLVALELALYGIPLSVAVSSATVCRNLVSLSLLLTLETWDRYAPTFHQGQDCVLDQQGFGLQLAALTALPNLRELCINYTTDAIELYGTSPFVTGTLLGCAALTQLRCLDLALFDVADGEARYALCELLRNLPNLEELGSFMFARLELWHAIHALGGHAGLKRLEFFDGSCNADCLQAMVEGVLGDFPGLCTLNLNLNEHTILTPGETVEILSALRDHPNLQYLVLSVSAQEDPHTDYLCRWIPQTLQALLGPGIQIT